ncbi:MAG TPA: type II toxin-antitoxin system RelE/ParE family toxin [Caldilineaceae bacterium]|nr:type II toxin-antitoxin system RelE/ParE family toxin [Caldilineaceae bacterium]
MLYRLKISKTVQREIEHLPGNVRQRVKQTIAGLAFEPRPANADQLEDELAGFWRIKLDGYRIIYTIDDDVILIEIVRVARRTPKTYLGLV